MSSYGRFAALGNHSQQESTRRPIYTITEAQEEVEDLGREVGPTRKIIIKLKTRK
jgi:hypothetical protein